MVRNYIRKTRDTYYLETLQRAVEKVKNNEMSVRKAAIVYGVPHSTLYSRVIGKRSLKTVGRGRRPVFTQSFEKNIAEILQSMENCNFCLTKHEVLGLVSHYATRNNITTPFKNNLPGIDWYAGFSKRQKLTLKNFQLDSARKADPFVIYGFYEMLQDVITRLDIGPNRIYCLSETICDLNPNSEIINIDPYYSEDTNSKGDKITVLLAANVNGEKIPPLICKEACLWNSWIYREIKINNNRINTCVFENYFDDVIYPKLCTNKDPLLIIYDGRSTHLDIQIHKKAAENNITIMKLPPNLSNLQPIDISARNAIKNNLEERLANYERDCIEKLSDDELFCFLTQTWDEIDSNMISEGFKKAGIWPVDREQFPRELFDQTSLTDWEEYRRNENIVLDEPFDGKKEISEPEMYVEDGIMKRDVIMELDLAEIDLNIDNHDEISNGADNEINYEDMTTCHVKIANILELSKENDRTERIKHSESVEHSDPLSEPSLSHGLNNLTRAINNLCGELVSVKNEMFSFKEELVKITFTMAEFNKRMANIEKKFSSS